MASIALTTLTEVKLYLGIAAATTTDDALLTALVGAASTIIETNCRRAFMRESVTEYLSGRSENTLLVSRVPIYSLTSIRDNLDREFDDSGDDIDLDDVEYDADSGVIEYVGALFQDGTKNVRVIYVGGEATTTSGLPDDLRLAATVTVAFLYNRAKQRADGIAEETLETSRVKWANEIPLYALTLLGKYTNRATLGGLL